MLTICGDCAWGTGGFDRQVRWVGWGMQTGRTVDVGVPSAKGRCGGRGAGELAGKGRENRFAVVVEGLDAAVPRTGEAQDHTGNHAQYQQGRRFDLTPEDGTEVEVVRYLPG